MTGRPRAWPIGLACLFFVTVVLVRSSHRFAWDYAINWTAAQAVRSGVSVYDREALRALGAESIGQQMSGLFDETFRSYIGLPTTALLLTPFTFFAYATSLWLYRLGLALAFLGAMTLVGRAVPLDRRRVAWITGVACLLLWEPVVVSIRLGQVDAWIALALATAVLAAARERWAVAGVGIGFATLLKVSPGFLLLYCLLKRQWQASLSAIGTIGVGLVAAWVPRRGADLNRFFVEIAPEVRNGSLHVQNQALGAWLARLTVVDPQFLSFQVGPGAWQSIGVGLAVAALVAIWWPRRRLPLVPGELGVMIVVALLAGPISWDHYASWAVIPAMLLVPEFDGATRRVLVGLLVILALRVPLFSFGPDEVAASWWLRPMTGTQTIALLGTLCLVLLRPSALTGSPLTRAGG